MEANAWKPVAFASRSMSSTEVRYAQIEKEALAVYSDLMNRYLGMSFRYICYPPLQSCDGL